MQDKVVAHFTSTRHPRERQQIHVPQPHFLQNTSVYKQFHNENGPVRTGTLCHRKNGNRWDGQQEDRDHGGHAEVDTEAVVAEAALGGRDGVAQRWATMWCSGSCVSCLPYISRLTSLELRVICAFFSEELMTKSGTCSCRITDQRLGCHRAVRFSRQCSQTSAGAWHRARPQQRSEERLHSGCCSCKTHFSRVPRHFSLCSCTTLQTNVTPLFVVQFHTFSIAVSSVLVEFPVPTRFLSRCPLSHSRC